MESRTAVATPVTAAGTTREGEARGKALVPGWVSKWSTAIVVLPPLFWLASLALACLILGSVVSYAKARAEGLGMTANVGIAERADRLVVVLAATGLVGWFLPEVFLTVVLGLLALASLITVVQRMLEVRRQALDVA